MTEEGHRIITTIKQMEASLDDVKDRPQYQAEDEALKITYPLTRCLQVLKEKHLTISKLHRERFEQVKKLVQALESYSSHLESSFIKIQLPPTAPNSSIPPTFDLSPSYVEALDNEFTRVYEEYTRRVATVKALAENIIQLWAELGTPQAQTDAAIVKYYRDSPEQLGLHEDDLNRLKSKRDKLADEKKARERRLKELRMTVEGLWDRLGIDERERKQFLNTNRGCGVRQINEFEDELSRLNELKRQNLHLFVEDARYKLQQLWDGLYFSEDEMLEFTPAFSDVYSDALLEAHEQEIDRLEALKEQRAPTLALIDQHRSLVKDRDDLQAASQDASRLMMRGQKGEKRDPTRLLREEKMRKRIAKDLPKIAVQLRKALEKWEDEYGRPFLVHGERYIDELDASEVKAAPGPRSRTPAPPSNPPQKVPLKSAPPSRANSTHSTSRGAPSRAGDRAGAKTPGPGDTIRKSAMPTSTSAGNLRSPTRIPARAPLSNMKHGGNSPERGMVRPHSRAGETSTIRKMGPPARAPPPKMRDIFMPPPETPTQEYRSVSIESVASVRPVALEDVYNDRRYPTRALTYESSSMRQDEQKMAYTTRQYPTAPASRQISNTSSSTTGISGSENWETYSDVSEPEEDATETYAKMRASQTKRTYDYGAPVLNQSKRLRGMPPPHHSQAFDAEGNRIVSGSEANWTDDGSAY